MALWADVGVWVGGCAPRHVPWLEAWSSLERPGAPQGTRTCGLLPRAGPRNAGLFCYTAAALGNEPMDGLFAPRQCGNNISQSASTVHCLVGSLRCGQLPGFQALVAPRLHVRGYHVLAGSCVLWVLWILWVQWILWILWVQWILWILWVLWVLWILWVPVGPVDPVDPVGPVHPVDDDPTAAHALGV
jgi:hypothetical protein